MVEIKPKKKKKERKDFPRLNLNTFSCPRSHPVLGARQLRDPVLRIVLVVVLPHRHGITSLRRDLQRLALVGLAVAA